MTEWNDNPIVMVCTCKRCSQTGTLVFNAEIALIVRVSDCTISVTSNLKSVIFDKQHMIEIILYSGAKRWCRDKQRWCCLPVWCEPAVH